MHRIYTGKTYLISILYLLLAFCQTIFATERHILELKQEKDKYNATPYFQYLEDKKHSIKREDILNGNLDKEFLPYENKNINFGFSRSTFWFRLKLKYISRSEAVLLEIPWPHLDYIDVYISGKEQILAYKSGRLMPYKDRIYPHKNFIFEIPYDPDELVIYIKVRSDETLIFPIHIFDKSYFAQADRKEEFVFGIYYGIILVMFFYNFLLYITLRNRYYFYYLLYVLTLGLYQLALNGIIFQFWPENPGWNKIFLPISQLLLQLTLLLFFKNLLNINRKNRFDYNTILILLGILFLSLGSLSVLEYATIIQPLNTLGILYMVFSIILTVRSYKQGNRTALFFLFNWLTFFVGGITLALRNFGLVPDNFYTTYSLQIGSTLEMLLLSLALADRINRMKDELAVLNTTLEEKVEERTEELLSVLKELRKKNDIIESELELASDIQKCIMPHKDLELSFLKVAVHCEYLTSVGGDYFDILPSKKNNMGVLIADVSGHGIPAALLTTMAKISFMNAMGKKESPIEVFKEVDRNISEIITTQNYLTAFLLVVSKDGKLSFSSAGHRPAIVYRRDQERMDEFKTEGLFLGILEKDKDYFTQKSDKVNRGDRILLYTDGIIDAFDSEEERWGEDRLLQCFQESVDLPVTEARDYIIGKWKEYVGEMGMVDDSTLILLEYQPDTEDTTQKSTR